MARISSYCFVFCFIGKMFCTALLGGIASVVLTSRGTGDLGVKLWPNRQPYAATRRVVYKRGVWWTCQRYCTFCQSTLILVVVVVIISSINIWWLAGWALFGEQAHWSSQVVVAWNGRCRHRSDIEGRATHYAAQRRTCWQRHLFRLGKCKICRIR